MQSNERNLCRICKQHGQFEITEFRSNQCQILKCCVCGSVFAEKNSHDNMLATVYDDLFAADDVYKMHYKEYEMILSGHMPISWSRGFLLKLAGQMVRGRDLVEIGGGTGVFGYFAERNGWKYKDYDISHIAVQFARKLCLEAYVFNPEDKPPIMPSSCDLVVMWEVIEHVWEIGDYIRLIREALKPGGLFIFSTPNFLNKNYQMAISRGSKVSSPPVHVNFFSPSAIRYVLSMNGFNQVRIYTPRIKIPAKSYKSVLNLIRTVFLLEEPGTIYGIARVAHHP